MNRKRVPTKIGMALMAVALATGSAWAQADAPPPPPGPDHDVSFMRMGGGPMGPGEEIGFVRFEADLGGKTVTGAPFSATMTTQTTQVLADGNHIDRTTTGTVARDGQGRTRREMTLPAIGPWAASGKTAPHVVFINDRVAGTQYVLQPDKKVARQVQRMGRGKHGGRSGPGPQGDVLYGRGPRRNAENVTTTSLGTQTINGVQAEGTRTTRTIPAGQIGNANPIVITSERWYSPDLQTVVMSKRSDPFAGETTFQLTNIQRQEPDASLFQVPSDYTVRPEPAGTHRRFKGGPGQPPPPPPSDGAQQD